MVLFYELSSLCWNMQVATALLTSPVTVDLLPGRIPG